MTTLPLLVIWGVWLARNKLIFTDNMCTPTITASLACGILSAFPQHASATRQRKTLAVEIDRMVLWGFFDGASQNNLCGGGAFLFLSGLHFFELMVGLGEESNNSVELLSLKILLMFAAEKGCRTLNVFGDSMNVINCIKGIQHWRNIRLENILSSIRVVIDTYVSFNCQHVYRENNQQAEKASKEVLQLEVGR